MGVLPLPGTRPAGRPGQREGDEPLDHGGAHLGRDAPGRLIYGHVWGVNEPVNCNSGELGRLYMGMYGEYTPPN